MTVIMTIWAYGLQLGTLLLLPALLFFCLRLYARKKTAVMASLLFVALMISLIKLIVDLIYAAVDPKLRSTLK